jgi:hypothetical protein
MSKRAKVIDIGERKELFRLMDLEDTGYFDPPPRTVRLPPTEVQLPLLEETEPSAGRYVRRSDKQK